jgi:hypothetical protein
MRANGPSHAMLLTDAPCQAAGLLLVKGARTLVVSTSPLVLPSMMLPLESTRVPVVSGWLPAVRTLSEPDAVAIVLCNVPDAVMTSAGRDAAEEAVGI